MVFDISSLASVFEHFRKTARDHPDNVALVYLGRSWTYSMLAEMVAGFAVGLSGLNISRDDRVVLYLPNSPQWIIAWLAVLGLGATAVPVSPIYTPSDLKYLINDSMAETVICLDTNFGYLYRIFPETCLKRVIVTNVAQLLPWWKRIVGLAFDKVPRGRVAWGENVFGFKEILGNGSHGSLPERGPCPDDIVSIIYTGGTTGIPKGVPYSNTFLLENAFWQRKLRAHIRAGSDILVQGAPLFHSFGLAMYLGSLLAGDTIILLPRVNLDALFEQVQRYKARSFFGVPAMYRMILDHDRLKYYDLSSLMYCGAGGDALPGEIEARWLKKFNRPLYQGYGSTETGGVSGTPMGEEAPTGSCGKLLPYQAIRLIDPDSLKPMPRGKPGEMLVSSKHMVRGYWNKPEETSNCFMELDNRLWYRTGDMVRMDDNGWLFFVDRTADIIKHKGYRVSCSEIEMTLQDHPSVAAACVVGVPDKAVGEKIKAFVVLKEDLRGISAYDLIAWCKERLTYYKVPYYIEFRDMLPKSKVGKLLRRELRAGERFPENTISDRSK